jgi:hypothetical protein
MLAETGARGAELFDDSKDEKRDGVTWDDVDLERHVLSVFGKSRNREEVPLPKAARDVLERHRRYVDPPTDEWPVFPTGHFQSKQGVLEAELGEDRVLEALEERGDVAKTDVLDDLLRKHEIAPPSISKEGARRVMKRLTDEANIELEGGHKYLKPHGARRGLGAELYTLGESERPNRYCGTSRLRRLTRLTVTSKRRILLSRSMKYGRRDFGVIVTSESISTPRLGNGRTLHVRGNLQDDRVDRLSEVVYSIDAEEFATIELCH